MKALPKFFLACFLFLFCINAQAQDSYNWKRIGIQKVSAGSVAWYLNELPAALVSKMGSGVIYDSYQSKVLDTTINIYNYNYSNGQGGLRVHFKKEDVYSVYLDKAHYFKLRVGDNFISVGSYISSIQSFLPSSYSSRSDGKAYVDLVDENNQSVDLNMVIEFGTASSIINRIIILEAP